MADVTITAKQDSVWVLESPQFAIEGEILLFTLTVPYATTISAPEHWAFRNKTAATWEDATASVSGNVFTSTAFTPTADTAGTYVLNFKYVNGSQTEYKKLLLKVGLQEDVP